MARTEFLAGLVVALALIPEAISFSIIATVILGGLIQIVLGALGVAKLMRFVPRSVMVGFVSSLAILIFMTQVPELIGQTMINVKNGARTRLSTFTAGVMLMVLCIVFGPWVSQIPMAALVAVMLLVSFGTFGRHSAAPATLRRRVAAPARCGEVGQAAALARWARSPSTSVLSW